MTAVKCTQCGSLTIPCGCLDRWPQLAWEVKEYVNSERIYTQQHMDRALKEQHEKTKAACIEAALGTRAGEDECVDMLFTKDLLETIESVGID